LIFTTLTKTNKFQEKDFTGVKKSNILFLNSTQSETQSP